MKRKNKRALKQTEDYYPLTNPANLEKETNVQIPSDDDIKNAKRWVDKTEK